MVFLERLSMRSIQNSLPGLILAGILATMPTAVFAHGNGARRPSSHTNFLMSAKAAAPRVQHSNDQDFYQPPRDPQFNTARDQ
jgi:hypothetical protein